MAARVTLTSRLPEIAATLQRRVSADLKDGAEDILESAKSRIHSKSGALADSGEVKGGAGEYAIEFGAGGAHYARWIEFGRKNAPPYPFLFPAAEEQAPEVLARVMDTLRKL